MHSPSSGDGSDSDDEEFQRAMRESMREYVADAHVSDPGPEAGPSHQEQAVALSRTHYDHYAWSSEDDQSSDDDVAGAPLDGAESDEPDDVALDTGLDSSMSHLHEGSVDAGVAPSHPRSTLSRRGAAPLSQAARKRSAPRPLPPAPGPVPVPKRIKLNGATPTTSLVKGDGFWEEENERDIAELKAYMDSHRNAVHEREKCNNEAFASGKFPTWRCKPNGALGGARSVLKETSDYGLKSALTFNDSASDNAVVTYESIDEAAQTEAEVQLLGCIKGESTEMRGRPVGFLSSSNNETRTFEYVHDNLAGLLQYVPLRGGAYRSTAAQRLSEAVRGACLPVDVHLSMRRHWDHKDMGKSCKDYNTYCLALTKHDNVELTFNKDPTGIGKTASSLKQATAGIVLDEAWQSSKQACETQGRVGVRLQHLGLRDMPPPDASHEHGLSRVVIALVPEELMPQWETAAREVSDVYEREFGKGYHVWVGKDCVTRRSKDAEGRKRVLSVAHKLTVETNMALVWILKADSVSSRAALRDAPGLAVWYRIYDEMTGRGGTEPKNTNEAASCCVHTLILNATMPALQGSTDKQPNHPLRLALKGQNLTLRHPKHAAIVTLCSSPAWLRRMQGDFMAPHMPSGIQKIALRVKVRSLAGKLSGHGSDMLITDTRSMLEQMLQVDVLGGDARRALLQRCVTMLEYSEGGGSVHSKIEAALEDATRELDAVPRPVTLPERNASSDISDGEYARIEAERGEVSQRNHANKQKGLVLATMVRLFQRLQEAVCGDPRPDCPVTLEPIPVEFTCILPCCSGMIDKRVVARLGNNCPLCRKPLGEILRVTKAVEAMAAGPEARSSASARGEGPAAIPEGDSEALVAAYTATAGLSCGSSLEAVSVALNLALQWKPRGLRVLLCFTINAYSETDERSRLGDTRRLIMQTVAGLDSVEAIARNTNHLANYKDVSVKTNQVLFINTSTGSNSLAGHDLGNTDLVLFDNMANQRGQISSSTIVQAIGRAMRPQKCSEEQAKRNKAHHKEHGKSNWAPKLVLTINRYQGA